MARVTNRVGPWTGRPHSAQKAPRSAASPAVMRCPHATHRPRRRRRRARWSERARAPAIAPNHMRDHVTIELAPDGQSMPSGSMASVGATSDTKLEVDGDGARPPIQNGAIATPTSTRSARSATCDSRPSIVPARNHGTGQPNSASYQAEFNSIGAGVIHARLQGGGDGAVCLEDRRSLGTMLRMRHPRRFQEWPKFQCHSPWRPPSICSLQSSSVQSPIFKYATPAANHAIPTALAVPSTRIETAKASVRRIARQRSPSAEQLLTRRSTLETAATPCARRGISTRAAAGRSADPPPCGPFRACARRFRSPSRSPS